MRQVSGWVVAAAVLLAAALPVSAAYYGGGGSSVRSSGGSSIGLGGVGIGGSGVNMGTTEEDPALVRERYKQKAEEDYKEGVKARAAGDTSAAVRAFLRVAKMEEMRTDSPYPLKAFEELKVITEEGRKELQVAREFLAGEDAAAGLSELKRITRTYYGLWPAKEAGKLALQLDRDPQFQATLKTGRLVEELRRAETLEAEAAALAAPPKPAADPPTPPKDPAARTPAAGPALPAATVKPRGLTEAERRAARIEKLLAAYDLYGRIAQQGPDTEPGRKAAAARERLEKDADLIGRIKAAQAERQARSYLSLVENYLKAGRLDPAREFCKKILSEFPQTPQAAEAKAILDRLK